MARVQGMYSNVQAELVSLKVFSNEQSGFVNNLNEENGRLVAEIQRLKKQAETRDRQLHESVAIAKKVSEAGRCSSVWGLAFLALVTLCTTTLTNVWGFTFRHC